MTLELLYMPGCPHHGAALDLVRDVLRNERLTAEFSETPIANYDEAKRHRFPGSPTFRVNGRDIEVEDSHTLAVGLACRTYGKLAGVPPRAWLERALREAQISEEDCE
jgi:hypothetical protein